MSKKSELRELLLDYNKSMDYSMDMKWIHLMARLIDAIPDAPPEPPPFSQPQPDYIAKFVGVRWYNTGDGQTKDWWASFVRKDGITLAVPLDQCRNPDGTPWAILGALPPEPPLWEGEIWHNPGSGQFFVDKPGSFGILPWRKIKAREVRE